MPYQIIKQGKNFKIKNTTTKKLHKNTFKTRAAADIQLKNRIRFQRLMDKQRGKVKF
tara:strand:- start:513 stop:683 length:171 start_codon:yes stop_codon:yes gene_type:complete